jgi:hypothetical protein
MAGAAMADYTMQKYAICKCNYGGVGRLRRGEAVMGRTGVAVGPGVGTAVGASVGAAVGEGVGVAVGVAVGYCRGTSP